MIIRSIRLAAIGLLAVCSVFGGSSVDGQIDEGFEMVINLTPPMTNGTIIATGWEGALRSSPLGLTGIFQGVAPSQMGPFEAHMGPADSYMGASFTNAGSFTMDDVISTWMLSPVLEFENGDVISFFTRTVTNSSFPDRLNVRLSTSGASTNVGGNPFSVGAFNKLLLSINPNLMLGGYPTQWTQFDVEITGLSGPTEGRFAFHYFVTNLAINANVIGIDTVQFGKKTCALGDVNLDGEVSLLDVQPFVQRVTMSMFQCEADVNQDQAVDLLDVAPFVVLLSGG
jgi:hypothetical protein